MAFLEERIDPGITVGATGGPTNIGRTKVYLPNGRLQQNFAASMPVHKYDVSHGIRTSADYDAIIAMFYVVNFTPYEGFRFKDWRDFKATQANSALTLITGSTWQLERVYRVALLTFHRKIRKPVASTVVVYRTRSAVVSTASATIDYTTGIATVSGHVGGDTYTWTGEFDVPVTFTDDEWMADLESGPPNTFVTPHSIKLEELKAA
jgi:uncharacterized protein (TIGR02217 family)